MYYLVISVRYRLFHIAISIDIITRSSNNYCTMISFYLIPYKREHMMREIFRVYVLIALVDKHVVLVSLIYYVISSLSE